MSSSPFLTGVRVLVIDDNADSCVLLQLVFELEQAQVMVTDNAMKALEAIPLFNPDIIISDINLPEIDGNTFMRTLRAQGNLTPAISVSAAVRQEEQQAALNAGYQSFLKKPFDPSQLVAMVLELLRTPSSL